MKISRLKPALIYQLSYVAWTSLCVLGIVAAIMILTGTGTFFFFGTNDYTTGSYFVGGTIAVTFFVIGAGGIREDLKFMLQHGIGRKTTYLSNILGSLISGAALGLICEVLNLASIRWPVLSAGTLFLTDGGLFEGWMLHTLSFFIAWQMGSLISLIFYRMNKTQKIVLITFIIAMAVFSFIFGLNRLIINVDGFVDMVVGFAENPLELGLLVLPLVALGAIVSVFNFLLIYRAQIKE